MAQTSDSSSEAERRLIARGMDHSVQIAREHYASVEHSDTIRFRQIIDSMKVNDYQRTTDEIQVDVEEDVMRSGGYINLMEGEEDVPKGAAAAPELASNLSASGKGKGKGRVLMRASTTANRMCGLPFGPNS